MTDPCEITPITIDSGDGIFLAGAHSIVVDVWQPVDSIEWYDVDSDFAYSCTDVQYTVVNTDETPVDSSVFTVSTYSTPGAA